MRPESSCCIKAMLSSCLLDSGTRANPLVWSSPQLRISTPSTFSSRCAGSQNLGGTALWTPADNCSFPPLVIELPAATLPHLDATFRTLLDGQMRVEPSFHRLAHVAEFLDVLARHNGSRTPEHAVLRRAITLLLERLEEPWSISTLAEAVSMSTSQISRLFREHLGMGPAEFLRKERARRMAGLLLTSSDPVEAVAQRVGWAQASHASRAFRHTHGVSPLQYRRTHRPQTHP